jgi:hypothetical protein
VWESNPHHSLPKLLNQFPESILLGSNWVQKVSHLFDRKSLTLADHVRINVERDPRIRVPHLRLCDLRCRSQLEKHGRVEVTKCVKATTWNLQSVQNRPELEHYDPVRAERPAPTVHEKPPIGILSPSE